MFRYLFANRFIKICVCLLLLASLAFGAKKARRLFPAPIPTPKMGGLEVRMTEADATKAGLQKLNASELNHLNQWLADHPPPLFYGMPVVNSPEELKWVYATRNLNNSVQKQDYELSIGAIIQNEADYLKEWIEYHKLLGVQHFWIYNHLSTDHYLEVLEPYIQSGEVELIEWMVKKYPACQMTAYEDCIKLATHRTEWLALIDVDEFLVPHEHDSMRSFLKDFADSSQILVNWQIFGTSNIQSLPKGSLLIEHLTYKFPTQFVSNKWNGNQFVKAIVKPAHVSFPVISSHYYNLLPGYTTVNGSKKPVTPSTTVAEIDVEKIQLNHYWFRTLDFFYEVKIGRRNGVGEKYPAETVKWLLEMGQAEQDFTIQKFIPKLKEDL